MPPKTLKLYIPGVPSRFHCVCNHDLSEQHGELVTIGVEKQAELFSLGRIVIDSKTRICTYCKDQKYINGLIDDIHKNSTTITKNNGISQLNAKTIEQILFNNKLDSFMQLGAITKTSNQSSKVAEFNFNTVGNTQCKSVAGYSKHDITELSNLIALKKNENYVNDESPKPNLIKSICEHLFYFFFCSCMGLSFVKMAGLSNINDHTFKTYFVCGMQLISYYLKPFYLGASAFDIDTIENKHLHPRINDINCLQRVRGIIDSTYLYFGGSVDLFVNWITRSVHKQHNLSKLMAVMLPDGLWWGILKQYPPSGKNKDKDVFERCVRNDTKNILTSFQESLVLKFVEVKSSIGAVGSVQVNFLRFRVRFLDGAGVFVCRE